MQTPEREPVPAQPEQKIEEPEKTAENLSELEFQEKIKKASAPISEPADDSNVQAQVQDDQSVPTVTIVVPASTQQLDDWAKGDPNESLTWIAIYWLRLIKKAIHFGWRVLTKGGQEAVTLPIFLI